MSDHLLSTSGRERDRREHAERLFEEARALSAEDRVAFIAEACSGDARLRAELCSLLDHAAAAEAFFERLAEVAIPPHRSPGPAVGPYRILACIGIGGVGTVYRARDTRLNRDVALKFLPAHAGAELDAEQRLLVEARAAAALEHTNVCTVHEIGESEDGRPYIAMAYYEGETLKERLLRGPLPFEEAIDIAAQTARGLGAAHAHGVVHRDVKPGNMMVTPEGTVKLLDLGLAKVADVSLTRPGATPGTLAYMSPEQVRGDSVGPRSDLWSLGVVLYEMLTGARPFRGGNDRALIQAILHEDPEPVQKREPDAPRSLQRVTERLLEKDPDDRYGSANELLADLSTTIHARATRLPTWRARSRRRQALIASAGVLIIGLGGAALWLGGRGLLLGTAAATGTTTALAASDPTVDASKTIAVLPFTNLGGDPQEDFFSDGLAEELIGVLSRVRALRVAARTSAFTFKGQNRDVREIGAALNVGTVLEGSVRRYGDRIRVEARLISVEDGLHLWSEMYERELTDIFSIQRDLALSIAGALRAELTPSERARLSRQPTASAEAFALYLRGRHFWNQRTPVGYERAIEYFKRAIAADSQYAAAHAGLAAVYSLQGQAGAVSRRGARERTRAAALRALALDDGLAEAHAVFGTYLHTYEWDAAGAERELLRAIELNPSYPMARVYYGNLLSGMGRLQEAVAQKTRAAELEPLAPASSEGLAFTLLRAGRPNEALRHVRSALELDSTYWRAHAVLGIYYESVDRFDEALDAYERANALAGAATHRTKADMARVLARAGRPDAARRLITELRDESAVTGVNEPSVATALIALGEDDEAFAWLEESYRQRHPHLPFIAGDRRFAGFDGEPRFIDLMRRVGVFRRGSSTPRAPARGRPGR